MRVFASRMACVGYVLFAAALVLVGFVVPINEVHSDDASPEVAPPSSEPSPASALLTAARNNLLEKRYADSALLYVQVQEQFPRSSASNLANLGLREIEAAMAAGDVPAGEVEQFVARVPNIDSLASPEAKLTLVDFFNAQAESHEAAGDILGARPLLRMVYDSTASVVGESDADPALVGHMWRHIESAEKLGSDEFLEARLQFERYGESKETTVRSWTALWIATHYIEESALDRETLTGRYAQLRDKAAAAPIQDLMYGADTYGWIKAECLFGLGHAAFRMGDHTEALTTFERASIADGGRGLGAMKASFAASVTREVIGAENPDAGIDALADHLEIFEESPYRDDALLRMARLYERKGDYAAAREAYRMVIDEQMEANTAEKASALLLKMEGR